MDTPDPRRPLPDVGAASVEYGLLLALIAAAVLTAVTALGGAVTGGFDTACAALGGKPAVAAPPGKGVGLGKAPGQAKKTSSC